LLAVLNKAFGCLANDITGVEYGITPNGVLWEFYKFEITLANDVVSLQASSEYGNFDDSEGSSRNL
jgi:hypothetical protein